LGHSLTLTDEEEAEAMTIDAVTKAWARMGHGKFGMEEKVRVAFRLVESWTAKPSSLSAGVRQRGTALIQRINGRFA
jgi:L-asparaginase II